MINAGIRKAFLKWGSAAALIAAGMLLTSAQTGIAHGQTAAAGSLQLGLSTDRGSFPIYQPGETFRLRITPSQDAFVYCFYRQHDGRIMRIFPNRFRPLAKVRAGNTMALSGKAMQLDLSFKSAPSLEQIDCYGTDADPKGKIAPNLLGKDLVPSKSISLPGLNTAFARAGFGKFAKSNIVFAISK